MGLMSILALMIAPLAKGSWQSSLPDPQIETLRRERNEARADAERWEALAHRWEARYTEAVDNPVIAREINERRAQAALYYAQMQQAQANVQMAQQAMMNPYYNHNQGLLGQQQAWGDCTCVPSRHGFLRGVSP
jgi:hypothetical protein